MARLRLTLGASMGLVVIAGLALAALRSASKPWAGFFLLLTLTLLTIALLGAIFRKGSARAFFVGFSAMGWGYMMLNANIWWRTPDVPPELITTRFLNELYPVIAAHGGPGGRPFWLRGFSSSTVPNNALISRALDLPIAMPFANETPLEDVVQYIKNATTSPEMPGGIPIYVDPEGLKESQKTMATPVVLNLQGVSLGVTLELILKQIDMTYTVENGLVTITSSIFGRSRTEDLFRLIGHCLFAMLFACVGGFVGRAFWNAESRRAPAS